MPVNIQEVIDAIATVCDNKRLCCTITESLKGGLVTGVSAILGGLLLGPAGLALGGAIGGGVAAIAAKNKLKPVSVVLQEMTPHQKQLFYSKIQRAFRDIGVEDIATIAMLILSTTKFKELALQTVSDFLYKEMSLKIAK